MPKDGKKGVRYGNKMLSFVVSCQLSGRSSWSELRVSLGGSRNINMSIFLCRSTRNLRQCFCQKYSITLWSTSGVRNIIDTIPSGIIETSSTQWSMARQGSQYILFIEWSITFIDESKLILAVEIFERWEPYNVVAAAISEVNIHLDEGFPMYKELWSEATEGRGFGCKGDRQHIDWKIV